MDLNWYFSRVVVILAINVAGLVVLSPNLVKRKTKANRLYLYLRDRAYIRYKKGMVSYRDIDRVGLSATMLQILLRLDDTKLTGALHYTGHLFTGKPKKRKPRNENNEN